MQNLNAPIFSIYITPFRAVAWVKCNELHFQSIAHMQFFSFVCLFQTVPFVVFQVFRYNNIVVVDVVCVRVFVQIAKVELGLRRQTSLWVVFFSSLNTVVAALGEHQSKSGWTSARSVREKEIIGVGFLISVWTYAQQCWLHWSPVDLIEARFARFHFFLCSAVAAPPLPLHSTLRQRRIKQYLNL